MSKIRINTISVKNYRSFGNEIQSFEFPNESYKKPVAIVGYNNSGKTNLMNAILYGIGEKFVSADTFEKSDLHNLKYENILEIKTNLDASSYSTAYGNKSIKGVHTVLTKMEDSELHSNVSPSFFGANKHYNIFYINFHNIKEEISTQKTSWGNLKSFLARHIQKLVESDSSMNSKKLAFQVATRTETDKILENSELKKFIDTIKKNYSVNLRENTCEIDFGLPDYEDIFLKMMFKIGLNGECEHLVPIDHFGDGYISMFVMAVIQAIAESNTEDKCLFLFEEPESFLHENHQEYFYKNVLCTLSERGHQVIYTTHSDKMVDIFNTKSLIRIEFDEEKKQTVKRYNNTGEFSPILDSREETEELITLEKYNDFIRTIEPNLNKILFSRKVILVEGPNDVMAYKYAIEKQIEKLGKDQKYAKTHLNFNNMAIIPHHGKSTALILIQLCKHIGLNYFVINDLDLEEDLVDAISKFNTEAELKADDLYNTKNGINRDPTSKSIITINWKLIHYARKDKIHFNSPKLETVLGGSFNKNSLKLWKMLEAKDSFEEDFFPSSLKEFLEFDKIIVESSEPSSNTIIS